VEWQPIAPRELALPQPPPVLRAAIDQSAQGRMLATGAILAPNASMHFGFKDIRGYELPHSLRLVRLFKRLNLFDFDWRGIVLPTQLYPNMAPELQAYLNRACVRCVMSHVNNRDVISTNPNAYPRAYLAQIALPVTDERQAMEALLDGSVDLRRRSVFEGPGEAQFAGTTNRVDDSANITSDEPEKVAIHTQTTTRQLLVLADRMDLGWKVTVDDHPAEALTANYLFRGVFVPPGSHKIEWTYHAPGLATGVAISLTTLFVVLSTLIVTSIYERTRRECGPNR
jgi:Bacterial membrane protein YfhO